MNISVVDRLTGKQLLQAIDLARSAAQSIMNFIRKSQEARYLPHVKLEPE